MSIKDSICVSVGFAALDLNVIPRVRLQWAHGLVIALMNSLASSGNRYFSCENLLANYCTNSSKPELCVVSFVASFWETNTCSLIQPAAAIKLNLPNQIIPNLVVSPFPTPVLSHSRTLTLSHSHTLTLSLSLSLSYTRYGLGAWPEFVGVKEMSLEKIDLKVRVGCRV